MPYAPQVQYRGDQYIYDGISQGLGALAEGLMAGAKRRRQKEEWAKASDTLQRVVDQLAPEAGIKVDKDTPKELVPQLLQVAGQIEQQRRDAPRRALQLENEKLQQRINLQDLDTAAKHAAALKAAAPYLDPQRLQLPSPEAMKAAWDAGAEIPQAKRGPHYAEAMAAYVQGGGRDARSIELLGELAGRDNAGGAPRLSFVEDPVSGKRWATLGNQLQPSGSNPRAPTDSAVRLIEAGGRRYFVGPGDRYFDEMGLPVSFPSSVSGRSSDTEKALKELAEEDTPLAPVLTPHEQKALDWANANPSDPRAAKIKARLAGR